MTIDPAAIVDNAVKSLRAHILPKHDRSSLLKDTATLSPVVINDLQAIQSGMLVLRSGGRYNADTIKFIQRMLGANETGKYDQATIEKVKEFQSKNYISNGIKQFRLEVDGYLGPRTFRALANSNTNFTQATGIEILSIPDFSRVIQNDWDQSDKSYYERNSYLWNDSGSYDNLNYVPSQKFTAQQVSALQGWINRVSQGGSKISAAQFVEWSEKYGIDPRLAMTICAQESNFGTRGMAVRTNNPFNWGNNSFVGRETTLSSNQEEAFAHWVNGMKRNNYPLTATEFIGNGGRRKHDGAYYCPPNEAGGGGTYAQKLARHLSILNRVVA